MSTAFGYGVKVALAKETTYGTPAARNLFAWLTADGESLSLKQSRKIKPTLGNISQSYSSRSKADVTGGLKFYPTYTGLEFLFEVAFGSATQAANGTAGFYDHTYTLTPSALQSLTVEVDRDSADAGSAVVYPGCGISKLTLDQKLEEPLAITADLVGSGAETEVASTATGTLPALVGFDWEDFSLSLGGNPIFCDEFSLTIDNSLETDRYKLGQRTKVGLGRKDVVKISGKLSTELSADTYNSILVNYRNLGFISLAVAWTNGTNKLAITLPRISPTGDTPHAKNCERIRLSMPFTAYATLGGQLDEISCVLTNQTNLS